jgi:catechol 2,3-dioxygenase-like lactoylglutathione lyase family enzyme
MGLESCKVEATVAVSDMEKAKEFYEGKLGLSGGTEEPDGNTMGIASG